MKIRYIFLIIFLVLFALFASAVSLFFYSELHYKKMPTNAYFATATYTAPKNVTNEHFLVIQKGWRLSRLITDLNRLYINPFPKLSFLPICPVSSENSDEGKLTIYYPNKVTRTIFIDFSCATKPSFSDGTHRLIGSSSNEQDILDLFNGVWVPSDD